MAHQTYPHGHDDSAAHSHGEPYTPAEIEHFHAEDRRAARAIVTLMLSVFSLGFIGSLAIAVVVSL